MPMPVSDTVKSIHSGPAPAGSRRRETFRVIVPRSVNLQALLSRFSNDCFTLVRSVIIAPISAGQSIASRLAFLAANGSTIIRTSCTRAGTSILSI